MEGHLYDFTQKCERTLLRDLKEAAFSFGHSGEEIDLLSLDDYEDAVRENAKEYITSYVPFSNNTGIPPFFVGLEKELLAEGNDEALPYEKLRKDDWTFSDEHTDDERLMTLHSIVDRVKAVFARRRLRAMKAGEPSNAPPGTKKRMAEDKRAYKHTSKILRRSAQKRRCTEYECHVCENHRGKDLPGTVRVVWRYGSSHFVCSKSCLKCYMEDDHATGMPAEEGIYGEPVPDPTRPGLMMVVKRMPWEEKIVPS